MQFTKLPIFGWVAYKDSNIYSIFDFFSTDDRSKLYKIFTTDKTQYQTFKFSYSEMIESKLNANYEYLLSWKEAYKLSIEEFHTSKIRYENQYVKGSTLLDELGLNNLSSIGLGLITRKLTEKFSFLNWTTDCLNKFLLPSFYTPVNVCSLEALDLNLKSQELFKNEERGWYGSVNKAIVKDLKELSFKNGNTWDYKCDYWQDRIIDLSENLDNETLIRVWTESKKTKFKEHPAKKLNPDTIKDNAHKLSYSQVKEIEELFNIELFDYWQQLKEQEIEFGGSLFRSTSDGYFIIKQNKTNQLTNFTMTITSITKEDSNFFRIGFIYYKNQEIPFKLNQNIFNSYHTFNKSITEFFLNAGLGIPLLSGDFSRSILEVINKFNENTKIETKTNPSS